MISKPSLWAYFFRSVWLKRILWFVAFLIVFGLGVSLSSPSSEVSSPYYNLSGSSSDDYSTYSEEKAVEYDTREFLTATDSISTLETSETRIIKTASLNLDVKNTQEAISVMTTITRQYGGFVQSSSTWLQYDETTAGSVTLRVEVAHFEEALEAIKSLATVINSETLSGQDVTSEYVDLEARLTNLKAEEAQYLNILDQATTVEELLMVSDYLSTVRGEIESIQGQLKYLADQTDLSTITVSLYEEASLIVPTSDWQPVVVVKQAFNQLVVFLQGLVNGLIWVVIFGVPLWIVWRVVRGMWRFWRRRKGNK